MKNLALFSVVLFCAMTAQAEVLKTASLNLQGWLDSSDARAIKLNQMFQSQGIMKDVSFLMVQESIEYKSSSTASQLASAMGWKSFTHPRVSDNEGLGFIYPPETQIQSLDVYQIKARESETDYPRMALSALVKHKTLGPIRYVTTHLAHKPNMGSTRKRQITEILDWLNKLESKNPSQLTIFGGDFNTDISHPTYSQEFDLLANSNFKFQRSPSEGANYTWVDEDGSEKALIDYFFFNGLKTKSQTKIYTQPIEESLSDHALLIMTLDIDRSL